MKKIVSFLCVSVISITLAACGIGNTNTTYSRAEIGKQGQVEWGKIIAMTNIEIEGESSGFGAIGGGVIGGIAGSAVGGGVGRSLAIAGGAVGGAVAGNMAEKAITSDTAWEFIVQKTNGQTVPVVQTNELNLQVGDEVLLAIVKGKTRIRQKINTAPRQ